VQEWMATIDKTLKDREAAHERYMADMLAGMF
jgi:hypothetical protein